MKLHWTLLLLFSCTMSVKLQKEGHIEMITSPRTSTQEECLHGPMLKHQQRTIAAVYRPPIARRGSCILTTDLYSLRPVCSQFQADFSELLGLKDYMGVMYLITLLEKVVPESDERVKVTEETLDGVEVLLYQPRQLREDGAALRMAVIYLHGGGWCLGSSSELTATRWEVCIFQVTLQLGFQSSQWQRFGFTPATDICFFTMAALSSHLCKLKLLPLCSLACITAQMTFCRTTPPNAHWPITQSSYQCFVNTVRSLADQRRPTKHKSVEVQRTDKKHEEGELWYDAS